MPSFRRAFLVFLSVLAVGLVLGAEPGPETPAGPSKIAVKLVGGGPDVQGTAPTGSFRMKTAFGTAEVNYSQIKAIHFQPAEGETPATAYVTLEDENRLTGPPLDTALIFQGSNGPVTYPLAEVAEVAIRRPADTSILGAILGLITLTLMEIVLGVDNVIFLAIVASKVRPELQPRARRFGLLAALGTRLLLLATLSFLLGLTKPVFTLPALPFFHDPEALAISWRDIILLVGGTFLIGKSAHEMHEKVEAAHEAATGKQKPTATASFASVIVQIAIIDIVFSLDSVITAVGMVEHLWVMVTAMLIAVGVMMWFAEPISRFVDKHPTVKVLALSFLILIGVLLVAEGLGQHLNKGYIYFAMAFAVLVEVVNMQLRPTDHGPVDATASTG